MRALVEVVDWTSLGISILLKSSTREVPALVVLGYYLPIGKLRISAGDTIDDESEFDTSKCEVAVLTTSALH